MGEERQHERERERESEGKREMGVLWCCKRKKKMGLGDVRGERRESPSFF
jgi:hypothetical protein